MNGSAPSSFWTALKNSAPGPGTHWPDWAVGAPAGMCQAAANPRKWVQTDQVDVSQQRAQAVDAPSIAGPTMSLPVIDGIAPELALRAEVIGRDPADESRPVLFVHDGI
jgi:hypothetical protein